MKSLLVRIALLVLVVGMVSISTPVLASTYYTGSAFYSVSVAKFSTAVWAYYEDNIPSSVRLNYSTFYIFNWATSGMDITLFLNDVYDGAGGHVVPAYVHWLTIEPGEYVYQDMSLGYTSYTKSPGGGVIVLHSVCITGNCVAHGSWNITFWSDGSISSYSWS